MSTTADFVGRNCPHCGAIDSLHTDDALGEVACTECALVVAMGLEENALTRFNKDATYEDVDQYRERKDVNMSTLLSQASPSSGMLSSSSSTAANALAKVTLHPAMLNCIRSLQKRSAVPEMAIARAVEIAKQFVGGRRARGQRVEKQQDVAAACFMIAAEQMNHPVPLAELRCLDATLGDVEYRRVEIVKETRMEEEESRLKSVYVDNLLTAYLRRLGLQLSLYMPHCKRLLEAFQRVNRVAVVGVADKVIMALLLAQTAPGLQCEEKSTALSAVGGNMHGSRDAAHATERIYGNFAAKAHLDVGKVKKLMQTAVENHKAIVEAFRAVTFPPSGTGDGSSHNNCLRQGDDDTSEALAPGDRKSVV